MIRSLAVLLPENYIDLPLGECLLPFAWGPLPNKLSCFVSTCISSDDSFPSVRQEPRLGPGKGLPSCNRPCHDQVLQPGLDHKIT